MRRLLIKAPALLLAVTMLACVTSLGGNASEKANAMSASSPYAAWRNGPPTDPGFFPIGVWCQDPAKAEAYRALGINTFVALWEGPTEKDLGLLRKAGMRTVCDQNEVGLKHLNDPTIIAWMHGDEPDNYQDDGKGGYGPAVPASKIIADYARWRQKDPTRPVLLNLGVGVADDVNKGTYVAMSEYPEYLPGCDIVSFDIYPVVSFRKPNSEDFLYYVPKGVDRLVRWSNGKQIVWNIIECTHISNPDKIATPEQVKATAWMSIIHGSMGIVYFVHQFKPVANDAALLADPKMMAAVKAINEQILSLAPVLNSPTLIDGGSSTPDNPMVPMDVMVKQQGDSLYMLAVGMRNASTHATLTFDALHRARQDATVEVVGENRTLPLWGGHFEDDFWPYDVHIYRATIPPGK